MAWKTWKLKPLHHYERKWGTTTGQMRTWAGDRLHHYERKWGTTTMYLIAPRMVLVTPLREKMGNYDHRQPASLRPSVTPLRKWFIHSSFRSDYTHNFIIRQLFFQFLPPFPQKVRHFSIKSAQPMTAETKPRKRMEKERNIMKNSNQINVPQAREAMDKFKMQAAQDVDSPVTY